MLPRLRSLFIIAALTRVLSAEPPEDEVAFFEARIRPLLVKRCHECHSRDAKAVKGGLLLDAAEAIAKGGDSGAAITIGKPDESLLITAVRYTDGELQMPPAGKLPDSEIADLVAWVERGAPFPKAADAVKPGRRTVNIDEGRQFWSFRPLTRTEPPAVKDAGWPRQRIDRYLLSRLEAEGLQPSPAADRRTLIRRASFDLLGLPPRLEDIEAFVADDSAEAWPQLVERLLASPHYGERWGRYWLDLVRYCDVPEQWAQTAAQPWLYRDWVVQALNDDLPYDQFVLRQLAADQLPDSLPRDLAALGFLGLSPSYWKELKLAPDVIKTVVAEEWEERINTLSGTLLGLTVACARCHDHKFDPVTQQDYYALAGIFASIRQVPLPLLPRDEAKRVTEAHLQVKFLESEIERFQSMARREPQKVEEYNTKVAETKAKVEEWKRTPHFQEPLVYAVEDAALSVLPDGPDRTKIEYQVGAGQDVAMQIRGNPAKTGTVVPRQFLSVLSPAAPVPFKQGSGRRELAEAVFHEAAPLAARVMVNREWRHHFGLGLVDTPSNFGAQGSRPTHPELLDDLAARFIESGWSLKWLHREILLSAAYQQTSLTSDSLKAADPDNRLLGRMSRRRLDVEAWRDGLLAGTGTLDPRVGGAPAELGEASHLRRTLYATVRRRDLNDLLRLYDFPDPTGHSPARIDTTTPLQQLFVLNSEFLGRQAQSLAARARQERPDGVSSQIIRAYELLHGRTPSDQELALGRAFLGESPADPAWQQYAEVLLASNELMFID